MVTAADGGAKVWPAMLTWRSYDATRIESARVQLSGNRIKAIGRIAAAASVDHPAFSVSYDLVTDDTGATKRLSVNSSTAERERQLSIARDEENMWLISGHEGESQEAFSGAVDVDMMFSPLFTALAIRRTGVHVDAEAASLPVVYVSLPDLSVAPATFSYTPAGAAGITVRSPIAETTVVIDDSGFIVDYPGLAERI
jgi:hypothetical protein